MRRFPLRQAAAVALAALLAPTTIARADAPPLQALARDLVGAEQGVYVEAEDGTVLAAQAADRPVHPASVTKVATTLALLERLGPDHRFTTRLLAGGPRDGAVVHGDLVVEGDNDAFLVDESAARMLAALHALGVSRVTGDVVVRGALLFDWKPDPQGRALRAALAGRLAPDAWQAVAPDDVALRAAALHFGGAPDGTDADATPLVTHRSPPLRTVVKTLNGFSNNVFHPLADAIGGPPAVQAVARADAAGIPPDEIVIENGAGAGTTNRLSPRAAAAILAALGRTLAAQGLDYPDVLPVSGHDPGTLQDRFLEPGALGTVVGKTGTYGDVGASALVGVLRTARWGRVRFAILNAWVPVPEARKRQDAFVQALLGAGHAQPWPWRPPAAEPVTLSTAEPAS